MNSSVYLRLATSPSTRGQSWTQASWRCSPTLTPSALCFMTWTYLLKMTVICTRAPQYLGISQWGWTPCTTAYHTSSWWEAWCQCGHTTFSESTVTRTCTGGGAEKTMTWAIGTVCKIFLLCDDSKKCFFRRLVEAHKNYTIQAFSALTTKMRFT